MEISSDTFIRPSQETDADGFRDIRLEALKNHPDAFTADYDRTMTYPLDYWRERVRPDEQDNGILYLAEADGSLVGVTGISRGDNPKLRHNGHIWGVYVRPAWRGSGLADQLIKICIEWARARQLRNVTLGVAASNIGAIRCYQRCGFTVYGVEPEVIFVNGIYFDELLMTKSLRK